MLAIRGKFALKGRKDEVEAKAVEEVGRDPDKAMNAEPT